MDWSVRYVRFVVPIAHRRAVESVCDRLAGSALPWADETEYAKLIRDWLLSNGGRPKVIRGAITDPIGSPSLRSLSRRASNTGPTVVDIDELDWTTELDDDPLSDLLPLHDSEDTDDATIPSSPPRSRGSPARSSRRGDRGVVKASDVGRPRHPRHRRAGG